MTESIGLDLDGVLYDWCRAAHTYFRTYRNYTGTQYEFELNVANSMEKEFSDFLCSVNSLYDSIFPRKEVVELLWKLSGKYDIYYVTSRPTSAWRTTQKYFDTHNFPFSNHLIFEKDKATLVRLLKLDYFVEDSVGYLEQIAPLTTTFMVLHPYNQMYKDKFNTITSVLELERIFLK